MKIIFPYEYGYEFMEKLKNESGAFFKLHSDTLTYNYISWENEEVTNDWVKDIFDSCGFNYGVDYQLPDGTWVICPKSNMVNVTSGYITNSHERAEEDKWRENVRDLMLSMVYKSPLTVEINPAFPTNLERHIPTIILLAKDAASYNSAATIEDVASPIFYKSVAILSYMPKAITRFIELIHVQRYPEECLSTPFALIVKNPSGFGNTIVLKSTIFTTNELMGVPSIFKLLENPTIWQEVLIPMATADFSYLEDKFKDVPLILRQKQFRIAKQKAFIDEIGKLKAEFNTTSDSINTYIRKITDAKIIMKTLDEEIKSKTERLNTRINSTRLDSDFKLIAEHPLIESLDFSDCVLIITTKPIQIDDGPVLGGYEIRFDATTNKLNIRNLVNPAIQYDYELAHPHINQDGDICFGNYSDIFFYFETGEYFAGLEILLKFLSTYNPSDEWGRRLIYWDAEYTFRDIIEAGELDSVPEEYDDFYYGIYGEHLPYLDVCEYCGQIAWDCECSRCNYCNMVLDECECWRCPECGEVVEADCECERCVDCRELIEDCECERCDICGELLEDCKCE